jgi:protein-disulfide isomerase
MRAVGRVVLSKAVVRPGLLLAALASANVATAQPPARPVNERGPADAPLTVVEYCSYDSEACSRLDIVLGNLLLENADRVRFVFHHIATDDTPDVSLAYRAALAAGKQGQFWPMHGLLMANRQDATRAKIPMMAHQLGLDAARFAADLDSADTIAAAALDREEARAENIAAAPALVVNGQPVATLMEAKPLRSAITLALVPR